LCERVGSQQTEWLNAANLSYYHLSRILRIKVELVDVLSQHLELDENKLTLKIFRFPSFCRVLFAQGESQSLLCQLFKDHTRPEIEERELAGERSMMQDSQALRLCRELLITYLVIFIQDRHARARSSSHWRNGKFGNSVKPDPLDDPLLPQLLDQNHHIIDTLYNDALGFQTCSQYSTFEHFHFFGQRLQRLHQFSEQQSPADWRLIIFDRRDLHKRFGYWVAIGTFFFAILSGITGNVLSGFQLRAQIQQNVCSCRS